MLIAGVLLMCFGGYRMFSPAWSDSPDPTEGFMEGRRSFDQVRRGMDDEFSRSAKTSFTGFVMVGGGMVLSFVGLIMLKLGYMGRVGRYVAAEMAPVAGDTVNYLGAKTQDGVRNVASAISQGIAQGVNAASGQAPPVAEATCAKCGETNDSDAKFCNGCGAEIVSVHPCAGCGEVNDADASFCDNCGARLSK